MSLKRFIKNRKTVLIFLACVVLLAYLITPPAGVEYDLGGFLTIRNIRWYNQMPRFENKSKGTKQILLFTSRHGRSDWYMRMGQDKFEGCPVADCHVTNDRNHLGSIAEFDAVLMHYRDMVVHMELPDQRLRRPSQRYIMFFKESPQTYPYHYDRFNGFFNWTMTYRLDSDISSPYGTLVPKKVGFTHLHTHTHTHTHKHKSTEFAEFMTKKPEEFRSLAHRPGAIAWIVSHCDTQSDREKYVEELKKHIQVDIFGACGSGRCDDCSAIVERDYRFYLSFENSLCEDYVTEKLWAWLRRDIVPVVMGQANYSAIVPPHSVINALDFSEPRDLANYLKDIMADETEYLSYFWWKDYYVADTKSVAFCELCRKLHDPGEPPKVVEDLGDWWVTGAHCKSKGTLPWS